VSQGEVLFGTEALEYKWRYDTMKSDLLSGGAKPLLDRVREMTEQESFADSKDVLRVLENYLTFHFGWMNYRDRLAAGLSIGNGQGGGGV